MTIKKLPNEISSLVHHISLNKAGWWDEALKNLVLGIIGLSKENLSIQDLKLKLSSNYEIEIPDQTLEEIINLLRIDKEIVEIASDQFKVTEKTLIKLNKFRLENESLQSLIKNKFMKSLENHCPSMRSDEFWETFHDKCLTTLIKELGARIYELFVKKDERISRQIIISNFLETCPENNRNSIKSAIIDFLNPEDNDIRTYIFQILNAYFFLEASHLKQDTIEKLSKIPKEMPEFIIYVDTNFLFSILELHENPSNEAAKSLLQLIKALGEKVKIHFYMAPSSLEEAKSAINNAKSHLHELRLTPKLAKAALNFDLSGLVKRYAQVIIEAGTTISPDAYFDPYLQNFKIITEKKGIIFDETSFEELEKNSDIRNEIGYQADYDNEQRREKAKSHREWTHDILFWYYIKSKRPANCESPFNAKYWIITVDYSFITWDILKKREMNKDIPICIHPTTLTQMLQFWIPRTDQFEKTMMSTLRLPFLFQDFDRESEQVTLDILDTLSRFENIDDLSVETITLILLDEALRLKILNPTKKKEVSERIREILIEKQKQTAKALIISSKRSSQLRTDMEDKNKTIQSLTDSLEKTQDELAEQKKALLIEKDKTDKREKKIEILINEAENLKSEKKKIQEKKSFHFRIACSLILFLGIEVVSIWLASMWGSGENVFQRISSLWYFPMGGFGISFVLFLIILGKKRISRLGWPWKNLLKVD